MSLDVIKNIQTNEKNEEENKKNNEINNFSRNFNNCYKNLKNTSEKNNKKNKINSSLKEENNNLIKDNISNTSNQNRSQNINSLNELNLIDKNIQEFKKQANTKHKLKSKKISPSKQNNSRIILSSSSHDNLISTTNIVVQTTTVQSAPINNLKNAYLNSTIKDKKLIKSKSMKNLKKCSFAQKKFESFLERVKEQQKKKEMHIKNLKSKILESETSEMNTHLEINKKSKKLLKKNYRNPLYQHKSLNEEKSIEKNFQNFYANILKENQNNIYFSKKSKCKNKDKNSLEDTFIKFYENKIKWKKNVEQKNKKRKIRINQEYEEFLETFPYKPNIDKNSINMVNKLNRNRSIENFSNNNFYESGNNRETLDKFKAKLKPIINDYYNNSMNHIPNINRKNRECKRSMSEVNFNIHQKVELNDGISKIKKNKKNNKNKPKINYKLNEKKFVENNNNNKNKKGEFNNDFNVNGKDYYLMKQIEGIDNKKKDKNEGEDLYKLNIRPGGAWNKEFINKITPKKQCISLIADLL